MITELKKPSFPFDFNSLRLSGEQPATPEAQRLAIGRSGPEQGKAAATTFANAASGLAVFSLQFPETAGTRNPYTGELDEAVWLVQLGFGANSIGAFLFQLSETQYDGGYNSSHTVHTVLIEPGQWQVDGSDLLLYGGGVATLRTDSGQQQAPIAPAQYRFPQYVWQSDTQLTIGLPPGFSVGVYKVYHRVILDRL